jgi:hypothetical protein
MTQGHVRWSARDALVVLLYLSISVGLYWPLLPGMTSSIPGDPGDPLLNTWIFWWNAHHLPWSAEYWHAPAFAPAPNALALSETLLGLTWLTTPLQWLGASPLFAYNVLFLVVPVLNGIASYALCLHLTGRRDAAVVGSIYFTVAPYRAVQVSHVQTQAAFFMPLALLALHRYWETRDRRWLAALATFSFLNGCISGYHLLYFAIAIGLVLVWLMMSAPSWGKATAVGLALGAAALGMAPILMAYVRTHAAWGLRRGLEEMAIFSADVGSFIAGGSTLLLWRLPHLVTKAEADVYPGVVMLSLLGVGLLTVRRNGQVSAPVVQPRWLSVLRALLLVVAAVAALAAATAWLAGPVAFQLGPVAVSITQVHKPLGATLSALLIVAALSPRLWALARAGSVPALYGTMFVLASILMLGPDGEFFGHRFWYKAPFAWLVELPGFNSVRVPARMASIQILAASVLCAFVVCRLARPGSRRGLILTGALCAAFLVDGWHSPAIVAAPMPLSVDLRGALVMELPTRGWVEDVAAMYRGTHHGRPVVNGYSGYQAPHYQWLIADVESRCFESLNALRRGRSLDIVVWRADVDAPAVLEALTMQWPGVAKDVTDAAVVFRVPADQHRAAAAYDDPIDLGNYCQAFRAAALPSQ